MSEFKRACRRSSIELVHLIETYFQYISLVFAIKLYDVLSSTYVLGARGIVDPFSLLMFSIECFTLKANIDAERLAEGAARSEKTVTECECERNSQGNIQRERMKAAGSLRGSSFTELNVSLMIRTIIAHKSLFVSHISKNSRLSDL